MCRCDSTYVQIMWSWSLERTVDQSDVVVSERQYEMGQNSSIQNVRTNNSINERSERIWKVIRTLLHDGRTIND